MIAVTRVRTIEVETEVLFTSKGDKQFLKLSWHQAYEAYNETLEKSN